MMILDSLKSLFGALILLGISFADPGKQQIQENLTELAGTRRNQWSGMNQYIISYILKEIKGV